MATDSSILAWRISMDRGAGQTIVHGAAKSQTRLSGQAHRNKIILDCSRAKNLEEKYIFLFLC